MSEQPSSKDQLAHALERVAVYRKDPSTVLPYARSMIALADEIEHLQRDLADKQARIDALMLEFCPGEMSAEQRAEWGERQRAAHEAHAQSSKELAPCPFCGTVPDDDPPVCTVEVDGKDGAQIGCSQCDAQGPAAIDEEAARASWNLRASNEPSVARWRCVSYCRCTPSDQQGHFVRDDERGVWVKHSDLVSAPTNSGDAP